MEKKSENLKYILTRYDNYVNASNVKGTFLVALNTFIVGCILVNKNGILEMFGADNLIKCIFNTILYLVCLCAIIVLFFTIKALFPYNKSGNSSIDKYHSLIFFGSVCKFGTAKEYEDSFNLQSDANFEGDLIVQIYTISKGLTFKYKMLHIAMNVVYFELVLFILTLLLILTS